MFGTLLFYIFEGGVLLIRVITVTIAVLLIIRSLALLLFPQHSQKTLGPFYGITNIIVIPVRHILPEKVCTPEADYSLLVSAIIILLLSLGMEELLTNFKKLLIY